MGTNASLSSPPCATGLSMPPCWVWLWQVWGIPSALSYLPYARWQEPIDAFNLRRQNVYAENVLAKASPLLKVVPLLSQSKASSLPAELQQAVELVSLRDTQYTLQVEEVSLESDLYKLRLQRNHGRCQCSFLLPENGINRM